MRIARTELDGVMEITPTRHGDDRGYFSETFRADWFSANVSDLEFVQENQSLSHKRGTIRGLHAQSAPYAQGKLVRCVSGAIVDVAVDIRHGSPKYGKWVAATLTADLGNQLWIPPGFLHGYCTVSDDALVCYKVTNYYSPSNNFGVRWDDPDISVEWPEVADPTSLSNNDKSWPPLKDYPARFEYESEP